METMEAEAEVVLAEAEVDSDVAEEAADSDVDEAVDEDMEAVMVAAEIIITMETKGTTGKLMPPSATMPQQHLMLLQAHLLRIRIRPKITEHHQLLTVEIKTEQVTDSTNEDNNTRTHTTANERIIRTQTLTR